MDAFAHAVTSLGVCFPHLSAPSFPQETPVHPSKATSHGSSSVVLSQH